MKSRSKLTITLSMIIALPICLSVVLSNTLNLEKVIASKDDYQLLFTKDNNLIWNSNVSSGEEVKTSVIRTNLQNDLVLSFVKAKKASSKWLTLEEDSSIYNDADDSCNKNAISGISSIIFNSVDSSDQLSFYPGYCLNNKDITYLNPITLNSGIKYELDNNCNYFKIINETNNDIDINSLSIDYSCEEALFPKNNMKVLMIANSFGDDTTYFADRIAKGFGVDIKVHNAYIAGCTIDMHYTNLLSDNHTYSLRTMNNDVWDYKDNKSLREIILQEEYDIITFQQSIAQVGLSNSFTNLENLVSEVSLIARGNPRYMWHQTWSYDHGYMEPNTTTPQTFSAFNNSTREMFDAIVNNYKNIIEPLFGKENTIFNGTAVENLRTSYLGNTFSRDSKHLSKIVGRYLAGFNFIQKILDINIEQTKCFYKPSELSLYGYNAIKEAVVNSNKHPYSVTQSGITRSAISEYDLSNYKEIDPGLIGNAYYDSSTSTNYLGNVSGTSNKSVVTSRFTKDTLPIGSIIDVGESTSYEINSWLSNGSCSKSDIKYDSIIEIDDNFWSGYDFRAFNLYQKGNENEDLRGLFEKIFSNFHIYVPNEKAITLPERGYNEYAINDVSTFSSHSLDINNYERVELFPIIGFYNCANFADFTNSYLDDTAKKFVCTIPFHANKNMLPVGSVLILDSTYQYRSDYWKSYGYTSSRPAPVTTSFTIIDTSFMDGKRVRTFNVNSTSPNNTYIGQLARERMNRFRIYIPKK